MQNTIKNIMFTMQSTIKNIVYNAKYN
jgi:hypothetical protein